jgi:hypothetical protein
MRIRLILALVLLVALILVPVAGAASEGIGSPTLEVIAGGNNQTAVIVADGITNGVVAGNGAISWDIFLVLPSTVNSADFSVTPGSAWTALCPDNFSVSKVGQGTFLGGNAFLISGFCSPVVPNGAVTGSDVTVATITFSSSCTTTGSFNVNLSTGPQGDSTDMYDTANNLHLFAESDLTDGGGLCSPSAVTMSGFDAAAESPAPFVASAWPLLAGVVAVAAGGAYALLRRKS